MLLKETKTTSTGKGNDWPGEVDLILSALETGGFDFSNRRALKRYTYRVRAVLRLFSDTSNTPPWTLYTRDVNPRGLGLLSRHQLPLGYGGVVEMPAPAGGKITAQCTLYRCREAAPGWYEGSLHFNREQYEFSADDMPDEDIEKGICMNFGQTTPSDHPKYDDET